MEIGIFTRPEIGIAAGDDDPAAADVLYGAIVQGQHQLFANHVVAAVQNDDELVAADTIYGAVLKDVANHHRSLTDIFIARLMPQRIINLL